MCYNKISTRLDYILLMPATDLILHYVMCRNRSPRFRQLCSDWRRWVESSSFSSLKGGKGWIIPLNGHSWLWGGPGDCAQFGVLDCLFSILCRSRQRSMHPHGCWVSRASLAGADTSGAPEVSPRGCLCWQMWQLDQTELELLGHLLQQGPSKALLVS